MDDKIDLSVIEPVVKGSKVMYRCTLCKAVASAKDYNRFIKRHPALCRRRAALNKVLVAGVPTREED